MSDLIKSYLLALLLLSAPGLSDARISVAHPAKPCRTCHVAGALVNANNASELWMTQEKLCKQCHPGSVSHGHPTGFAPDQVLPAVFPLGRKGEMTCSTCHDVHSQSPDKLRTKNRYKDLCLDCHDQGFFAAMADGGVSLQASAHITMQPNKPTETIDAYSMLCLGCHLDETENGNVLKSGGNLSHGQIANHPIGSIYAQAAMRTKMRPQSTLRPQITLPDGRLSCASCHEIYSARHGAPLNRGMALCLECHDK